ncbi:MAG: putative glycolipid-binding domain-containing protein [Longimicrobiales bacterium]
MAELLQTVLWQCLDPPGMEICRLWQRGDSWRVDGTVLVAIESVPTEIRYEVRCNERWERQAARVALAQGPSTRTLELRRDQDDRWRRDGAYMVELDGATDVDLSFTPATNTLPIRRLSLEVGASASARAAWLKVPDLDVEVLEQRYTRVDANRYRYESAGGTFIADLVVDEIGLVVRYGQSWKRVGGHAAK